MSYCAPAEHDWQPYITASGFAWSGRYACTKCDVYGYRGFIELNIAENVAIPPPIEKLAKAYERLAGSIIPYLCTGRRDGEACGRPAIKSLGRQQRCWECRKQPKKEKR